MDADVVAQVAQHGKPGADQAQQPEGRPLVGRHLNVD